jgi:citrate synthase
MQMSSGRYMNAHEAAAELEISLTTLYAYVSRGAIRSEAISGSRRVRAYLAEDIQRLKERKEMRQHPEKVVNKAINWGEPIIDSALTLVRDDRVYYRGRDAVGLAASWQIEQVAALLWGLPESENVQKVEQFFTSQKPQPELLQKMAKFREKSYLTNLSLLEQFQMVLPLLGAEDLRAYHPNQEAALAASVRLIWFFTCFVARVTTPQATLSETLRQAWAPHDAQAAQLLNAAMILNADNELSVSAFTARCIASTGATLYGAIYGALAAFHGINSTEKSGQMFRFVRSIDQPQQVKQILVERLKQGENIPGFDHPLFPLGDARTVMLLKLLHTQYPEASGTRIVETIVTEVERMLGLYPHILLPYAALALNLNLTDEQVQALFALARCIGWIGHALEQAQSSQAIRPRARYTGIQP